MRDDDRALASRDWDCDDAGPAYEDREEGDPACERHWPVPVADCDDCGGGSDPYDEVQP